MSEKSFTVIALGTSGGPFESNLSAYAALPENSSEWILLDAGTILEGMKTALQRGSLKDFPFEDEKLSVEGKFFHSIKAYLISHAHLDHISGLVINSQVDKPKPLLGIDPTIDYLRDHIFNGKIWPNYGTEGENPLDLYQYVRLKEGKKTPIPGTKWNVEAFRLSHPGNYPSSAFLLEHSGSYLLYVGDTSSDFKEEKKRLAPIWERIGPLLSSKKLKGIFLECSYPMEHAGKTIYGHLEPGLMWEELHHLAKIAGPENLHHLPVIVTHRKDSIVNKNNFKQLIASEIKQSNSLQLNWIFPDQGDLINF